MLLDRGEKVEEGISLLNKGTSSLKDGRPTANLNMDFSTIRQLLNYCATTEGDAQA